MIKTKKVPGIGFSSEDVDFPEKAANMMKLDVQTVDDMINDFEEALDKKKPISKRIGSFFRGENKAGRIAGRLLDFATIVVPYGRQINTGREAVQLILERKKQPPMKDAISRALTGDGGGFIKVRNEEGKIDAAAIGATLIRLGILIGVLYAGKALGVLDQLMGFIG